MTWAPAVTLSELAAGGLFSDGDWVESKDQDPSGSVRLTQLADVGVGEFRDRSDRWLRIDQAAALRCTFLEPGDVLIARMPDPIGRACLAPPTIGTAVTAVDVSILRIRRPDIDPRYVMWAINAPRFHAEVEARQSGTTRKRISRKNLGKLAIPLPLLDEQRRIVALLEDHLSRLDAAGAYVRTGWAHAEAWCARLIDELLWSPAYPRREVRSLLREPMRNGRSDRAVQGSDDGTRTLTLTAVTRNSFIEDHTKITSTTPDRAVGLWLEPGDVLVQRSNTPELVGTSARYDGPRDWAIFPDLLIRLRAEESVVDSRFLAAALRSRQGHAQLRRRAKGAAGSMPKIDQETIGSVLIPVPSGEDQRRILAQVADADTGLRRLRAELEVVKQRSAVLRRSLLSAAFSGRLCVASSEIAST